MNNELDDAEACAWMQEKLYKINDYPQYSPKWNFA